MRYVDGYLLPVPKRNLRAYLRQARMGEKLWRKHGALDYKECVGDDLKTKWGIPFPRMMKLKSGETVVFSYIVFKSRAHRDRVNAKGMKEMEKKGRGDVGSKATYFLRRESEAFGSECKESILPAGCEENWIFWGGDCAVFGGNHFIGQSVCQFRNSEQFRSVSISCV